MEAIDSLMEERNLNIIIKTLEDSKNIMEKLISYDDMPLSQVFEDSIIKSANKLSHQLSGSKLLLEYMHGH